MRAHGFSPADKFLLGANATLAAACPRIPYSLGIASFGGRNWTVFSIAALIIPTIGTIWLMANPGLPFWLYLACGVAINLAPRQAYLSTGTDTLAHWAFLLFYAAAAVMTWARYVRHSALTAATAAGPGVQSPPRIDPARCDHAARR